MTDLTTRDILSLYSLGDYKPSLAALMMAIHYEANGPGAHFSKEWKLEQGPASRQEMDGLLRDNKPIHFILRHPRRTRNMTFFGEVRTLHQTDGDLLFQAYILCLEGTLVTGVMSEPDQKGSITFFWNPSSETGFAIVPSELTRRVI